MVTSSNRNVLFNLEVRQMLILESTWTVTPSIVTSASPDVTASVRVYYKPTGLPEVGISGAPVELRVTDPDGILYATIPSVTDVFGDASWTIPLPIQIGTWSFIVEGFTFTDPVSGDQYLGCEESLTQLQVSPSVTPLLALALTGLLLVL